MTGIHAYYELLLSNDAHAQLEGATQLRKLLSNENAPPIDAVIEAGAVPRFVQFLSCHQFPDLQFEAAWALTNISSGNTSQTEVVVQAQAIRPLMQLLRSPRDDVREQSAWCLGNIAGDTEHRDLVLEAGGMEALLNVIDTGGVDNITLLQTCTWVLSNLCRGDPAPSPRFVNLALEKLPVLLQVNDEEVLMHARETLMFINNITTGDDRQAAAAI